MITTNNDDLAAKINLLRSHGGVRHEGRFSFEDAGFNYRLSEIHGTMGIEQMKKFERILALKRKLAISFSEQLDTVAYCTPPTQPVYAHHTFQSYVVLLHENIDRDKLIKQMYANGIETTIGTYALHLQPYFARENSFLPGTIANSNEAYRRSLTLPLYPDLTEAQIEFVVETLKNILDDQSMTRSQ
jgi:perosamine synthetase